MHRAPVWGNQGAGSEILEYFCSLLPSISIWSVMAKGKCFSQKGLPQESRDRKVAEMVWSIFILVLQTGYAACGKEQGSTKFSKALGISLGFLSFNGKPFIKYFHNYIVLWPVVKKNPMDITSPNWSGARQEFCGGR